MCQPDGGNGSLPPNHGRNGLSFLPYSIHEKQVHLSDQLSMERVDEGSDHSGGGHWEP